MREMWYTIEVQGRLAVFYLPVESRYFLGKLPFPEQERQTQEIAAFCVGEEE